MKRNLIELQHSSDTRTLAQLMTLIREPEMVCAILAVSPQTMVDNLAWGAHLNALIVHDQDWYLLRDVPIQLLQLLLPNIAGINRIFYIPNQVQALHPLDIEQAANYLVSLQPCLLCEQNIESFTDLANPHQGVAISLARPAMSL
ncbi:hypothetical protein HQ393_09405 [Chitinibacter bivalviorum]|uniref:Uncharacterized protein n=1 Tax=Chitinibacter bivalviorum TaxID=2739434 RepID=A0A7H9BJG6_9NEIS|nr:hypothetical protein [Chitinibacter bivalviorum]QLG88446.1 hypothetical protein HQ393_09405 [Chitinibacter bivalviorum]